MPPTPAPAVTDRRALADRLLDELTGPAAHEWLRRLRSWPGGPISLVHLHVLLLLRTDGPLSVSTLAEALDVSEASASGIAGRMERRGLVERRRAADDRRVVVVHPTPRADGVIDEIDATRRRHLARLIDELSDDELAGFLAGLRAIRAARERLAGELHHTEPREERDA